MPKIRWLKSSPKSEQSWESEVSLSQSTSVIVTPFQNRTCLTSGSIYIAVKLIVRNTPSVPGL